MKSSVLVESKSPAGTVLLDLGDLMVVLDFQTNELRWEFPPEPTSRWAGKIALQMARALVEANLQNTPGRVACLQRSGCHVTVVELNHDGLVQIQTLGRLQSPKYLLMRDEALYVANAMAAGVRVLQRSTR